MTPQEYIYHLPKVILHNVWAAAIDEMQIHNSRTISECIVLAVGGEVIEGVDENGNYKMTFKMPEIAQIKREFRR